MKYRLNHGSLKPGIVTHALRPLYSHCNMNPPHCSSMSTTGAMRDRKKIAEAKIRAEEEMAIELENRRKAKAEGERARRKREEREAEERQKAEEEEA